MIFSLTDMEVLSWRVSLLVGLRMMEVGLLLGIVCLLAVVWYVIGERLKMIPKQLAATEELLEVTKGLSGRTATHTQVAAQATEVVAHATEGVAQGVEKITQVAQDIRDGVSPSSDRIPRPPELGGV